MSHVAVKKTIDTGRLTPLADGAEERLAPDDVDSYIRWYNEKRIRISLGSLRPIEYRESLGLMA